MQDFDPVAYQAFLDAAEEKYDFASSTCRRKDGSTYGIPSGSECQTGKKVSKSGLDKIEGTKVASSGPMVQSNPRARDWWNQQNQLVGQMNRAVDAGDLQGIADATSALRNQLQRSGNWVMSSTGGKSDGFKAKYRELVDITNTNARILKKKGINIGGPMSVPRPQPRQARPVRPQPSTGMPGLDDMRQIMQEEAARNPKGAAMAGMVMRMGAAEAKIARQRCNQYGGRNTLDGCRMPNGRIVDMRREGDEGAAAANVMFGRNIQPRY